MKLHEFEPEVGESTLVHLAGHLVSHDSCKPELLKAAAFSKFFKAKRYKREPEMMKSTLVHLSAGMESYEVWKLESCKQILKTFMARTMWL